MPGYLNQTNITLKDRLKLHTGFTVTIRSAGSAGVPAALEKMGKQFMRVSGRLYVPNTLDEIALSGYDPEITGTETLIQTTALGKFKAQLVRTGEDFIELTVDRGNGKKDWLLIPLNKVVSLEPLKERGNNEDTA